MSIPGGLSLHFCTFCRLCLPPLFDIVLVQVLFYKCHCWVTFRFLVHSVMAHHDSRKCILRYRFAIELVVIAHVIMAQLNQMVGVLFPCHTDTSDLVRWEIYFMPFESLFDGAVHLVTLHLRVPRLRKPLLDHLDVLSCFEE